MLDKLADQIRFQTYESSARHLLSSIENQLSQGAEGCDWAQASRRSTPLVQSKVDQQSFNYSKLF